MRRTPTKQNIVARKDNSNAKNIEKHQADAENIDEPDKVSSRKKNETTPGTSMSPVG